MRSPLGLMVAIALAFVAVALPARADISIENQTRDRVSINDNIVSAGMAKSFPINKLYKEYRLSIREPGQKGKLLYSSTLRLNNFNAKWFLRSSAKGLVVTQEPIGRR